jgi:cytochrome c2
MKRFLLVCTVAFALIFTSNAVMAQDSTGDANAGRQTFTTGCTSCHAVGKQVIGPDLKDVFKIRTEAWIIKFVHGSQAMVKAGDTAAVNTFNLFNKVPMPDNGMIGPSLTDKDIKNVIAYIRLQSDSLDKAAASAPAGASATATNAENAPYSETGIVHRLIFLDEPGNHQPVSFSDYGFWIAVTVVVILLAVVLAMLVKMNDLKEKTFGDENQENDV